MRYKYLTSFIFILFVGGLFNTFAKDDMPCMTEAQDTDTSIRAYGAGKGETAFEALNAAVANAMSKLKPRCAKLFPDRKFEYSISAKSTADGEEIELDTTIGEPSIICNEIKEDSLFRSYIVLSFDITRNEENGNEE